MGARREMAGGIDVRGLRSSAPEGPAPSGDPRAAVLVVAGEKDPSSDEVLDGLWMLESSSPPMQDAIDTARRAAISDAPVLLAGESGTGKNVLASAMHAWSKRRAGPFVTIPYAAFADQRHRGKIPGYVRGDPGRRTVDPLEAARGGTLFLDEVGDLSPDPQGILLRLITGPGFECIGGTDAAGANARVIAATRKDLEAEVAAGRFREDLYFRLNVVAIALPPLRQRREDLDALTDHILARLAPRYGRPAVRVSAAARRQLRAYRWPGNARELVNVLERAVILSREDTVTPENLPDRLVGRPPRAPAGAPASGLSLEELQRRYIEDVLADSRTLEEAAARLGINPTTLWRRRKRYGLPRVAPAESGSTYRADSARHGTPTVVPEKPIGRTIR